MGANSWFSSAGKWIVRGSCNGDLLSRRLECDDATKVLGRLGEPLLKQEAQEREGHVPNVV